MNKVEMDKLKQERETIQDNLIVFLDGLDDVLISNICQVVVSYYNNKMVNTTEGK